MLKRQKFKNTSKLSLNRKFFFGLIVLVLIILLGYFSSKLLKVKEVSFQLNNLLCVDQPKLEKDLSLHSKNILFVNQSDLKLKLLKKYPCIGDISLKKVYPQKIEISLDSREAKLTLNLLKSATSSGDLNSDDILVASTSSFLNIPLSELKSDKRVVIDAEGIVFSDDPSKFSVPQSDYIGRWFKFGDYIGDSLVKVVWINEKLAKMGLVTSHSLILGDNFFIVQSTEKIIFSLKKPQDYQIAALQLILQKAKIDSKEIETIDLRFDKPIVVYTQKKK